MLGRLFALLPGGTLTDPHENRLFIFYRQSDVVDADEFLFVHLDSGRDALTIFTCEDAARCFLASMNEQEWSLLALSAVEISALLSESNRLGITCVLIDPESVESKNAVSVFQALVVLDTMPVESPLVQ